MVDRDNIILPLLRIKLGCMKQCVKARDVSGRCFKYFRSKFAYLSDTKVEGGIFTGPEIKKLMKDKEFVKKMNKNERDGWESFISVCNNFLGIHKDPNYKKIVDKMLKFF